MVAAVALIGVAVWSNREAIYEFMTNDLPEAFNSAKTRISESISSFVPDSLMEKLSVLKQTVLEQFGDAIGRNVENVRNDINNIIQSLGTFIQSASNSSTILGTVFGMVREQVNSTKEAIDTIWASISDNAKSVSSNFAETFGGLQQMSQQIWLMWSEKCKRFSVEYIRWLLIQWRQS